MVGGTNAGAGSGAGPKILLAKPVSSRSENSTGATTSGAPAAVELMRERDEENAVRTRIPQLVQNHGKSTQIGSFRLGSSVRRGMTVLGKIPAVPKPINLPSQRLENRGLDPSVEIVPRGTFSWGTGRSPPTGGNSWGSVGLSSSPPVGSGAWNTVATSSPLPGSNNNSGSQNPSRPMSAGSVRPSSAGNSRPLLASTTGGRAWGGAAKLEEQVQPSRFNLTTAEFPTLGSEKNLNLRPQQNTGPLHRPTSADAMKERHLAYEDPYQSGTSVDRPISADGTKERKLLYPGVQHADRPTSADGTHPEKGRQQPALRLPNRPPFADGMLPGQIHPMYTGVVGHGTAGPGPGPGNLDRSKQNLISHRFPVHYGMTGQGREFGFPGASQHNLYFSRPGGPHGNDVVVLPMDARPEVFGSYAFDARPNHPDMSRANLLQPNWGPNHLDRSGIPQGQFLQSGASAEHFPIRHPPSHHMEAAGLHEPAVGNRRDGVGTGDKAFGEQRGAWAGTNMVYIGASVDARGSSIPMAGTGQEFPRPDMFLPPWGHQPMHVGWGGVYGGDKNMGMYQEMPSSLISQHNKLMEKMPQGSAAGEGVSDNTEKSEKRAAASIDKVVESSSLGGHQATVPGNAYTVGADMHYSKQEEATKTSSVKILAASPDISKNRNNVPGNASPLAGTQPSNIKQEDEGTQTEQNREAKKVSIISSVASKRRDTSQGSHQAPFVAKDSNTGSEDDAKITLKRKTLNLQSTKSREEMDLSVHEKEERASFPKASDGNSANRSNFTTDCLTNSGTNDLKDVSTDVFSKTLQKTQPRSLTRDFNVTFAPNSVLPDGVSIAEEEKATVDDGLKTKRNGSSARRAHNRSMHDSHSVDRQQVNHGMVWAPKPMALGATKQEVQLPAGDTGDMNESVEKISADLVKKRRTQPPRENESNGESQVQQMQSATNSQQGQGQQVQESHGMSSKRPAQQAQHQRGERSSKKQGHRVQQQQTRSDVSEHSKQDKQSVLISCKNLSPPIEHQQSSTNNHIELEPSLPQIVAMSEREAQAKYISPSEKGEKAGEVSSTCVLEKPEGKKTNSGYVRKPARNQHRQQHEQEYEVVNNYHGQYFDSKEEKYVAEDPVSETSALSSMELRKKHKEVKSRSSRNAKQKRGEQESAAPSVSREGHVLSRDRSQVEVRGEICVPYLAIEAKMVKERTQNQKPVREQEMHIKQSAASEHRHFEEEPKADTLSCESSTVRNEKKLYVRKQARKNHSQQEYETTSPQGLGRQEQTIQEVQLSNKKGEWDGQGSQPSGTHSTGRKNDMERYRPVPARQLYMQGQQSEARGSHGQRTSDLTGAQAIQASYSHVGSESAHIIYSMVGKGDEPPYAIGQSTHSQHGQRITESTLARTIRAFSGDTWSEPIDSVGKSEDSQPCAMGHRDENKAHESSDSGRSKKQYVVKSGGQRQESASNVDEEAPIKEDKWQRSHRTSIKEGMKLYIPKPARQEENLVALEGKATGQEETSVALEGKAAKETGTLSLPEHHDPVRNVKEERARESDNSHRSRNHFVKTLKYMPTSCSSKKALPPLENINFSQQGSLYVSRMDEMSGSIKEHKKDQELGFPQKAGSRRGNNSDVTENLGTEAAEGTKPRQYQRKQYHSEPVAQQLETVKPQAEEPKTHRPNNRQVDQGYARYERRAGPRRGRGYGYGYGYHAGEHVDSSDIGDRTR